MTTKSGLCASVESFYQGSKVFSGGGPYTDIYEMNSLSEEDLCKLFGQENEDCKMTMNRLRIPGQEPVLFKVF